jgi:GT2 family glycosyltransferase
LGGTSIPNEIIVVGRTGDQRTETLLTTLLADARYSPPLRAVWVTVPGHIAPVRAGLAAANGEIVVMIDDDVTVTSDWLKFLLANFSDPSVGVVGGRVITPAAHPARFRGRPGHISWYGRHWGNLGSLEGEHPLDVAAVMEGNWAWRRDLLASLNFDPVLDFDDSSMYGLDLCSQACASGSRVLYEPRALVYHHAAPRAPELDRADRPRRLYSYCRNYTYILLRHLPWWRKPIFLLWWFLIGERGAWGPVTLLADTLRGDWSWTSQLGPSLRGKWTGLRLWISAAKHSPTASEVRR